MQRLAILLLLFLTATAFAQKQPRKYPPKMDGAITKVYKTVGDTKLNVYIYQPRTHEANESRIAIVFFFGGGWKGGSPQQFEQHCKYLASRGMIAMTADYRVRSRNQTLAKECVMDAKSAVRWIRKNAEELGVDPDRIVAGGGSAGGHIAACTATLDGFEEAGEDTSISSKPNGLALFNPALVLDSVAGVHEVPEAKRAELRERMGVEPFELSPFHNLNEGLPPTIVFHGTDDKTVRFETAEIFCKKASKLGSQVYLASYDGQGHGFFNYGRDENKNYLATMLRLDQFLVDHGLLEGPTPKEMKIIE